MSDRLLLDTCAASAAMRLDAAAVARISEARLVYLPGPGLGELYYGALHASAAKEQLSRVEQFEIGVEVIHPDSGTCRLYGSIKADLRRTGRIIPENDIWIAAIALQHDLAVITQDKHFGAIDSLAIVAW